MSRVLLLPAAERDLEEIHEFTVDQWGGSQARRYFTGLREAFERLGRHPKLGRQLAGPVILRVWNYESHRIVYRQREDGVEIVRVFHAARDLNRILEDSRQS